MIGCTTPETYSSSQYQLYIIQQISEDTKTLNSTLTASSNDNNENICSNNNNNCFTEMNSNENIIHGQDHNYNNINSTISPLASSITVNINGSKWPETMITTAKTIDEKTNFTLNNKFSDTFSSITKSEPVNSVTSSLLVTENNDADTVSFSSTLATNSIFNKSSTTNIVTTTRTPKTLEKESVETLKVSSVNNFESTSVTNTGADTIMDKTSRDIKSSAATISWSDTMSDNNNNTTTTAYTSSTSSTDTSILTGKDFNLNRKRDVFKRLFSQNHHKFQHHSKFNFANIEYHIRFVWIGFISFFYLFFRGKSISIKLTIYLLLLNKFNLTFLFISLFCCCCIQLYTCLYKLLFLYM